MALAGLMGTMLLPHFAIAKSEPTIDFGKFQTGMSIQLTGYSVINL